jgi:restriction endonuclease S subunit
MKVNKAALDEIFNIGSSKRVLKSQWTTEGVPFYRGREITRLAENGYVDNELFIPEDLYSDYADKYGVPKSGDIVITAIGTIGNSYIVREGDKFYFKDASVLWLNKKADVSSEFINLWLKSPMFTDQLDVGNGATVDTLTIKKLQSVTINLPTHPEQQRIVAILDEAFDGIATAKANAEKNLQNARALFESYLQSVFIQRGEGWVDKPLSELCDIKHGFAFKSEFFASEGDYVLLTPGNFYESGGYRDRGEKQKYYTGEIPRDYVLNESDLLVAMTEQAAGLLGSPILVPESDKFLHNQRLGKLCKSHRIIPLCVER